MKKVAWIAFVVAAVSSVPSAIAAPPYTTVPFSQYSFVPVGGGAPQAMLPAPMVPQVPLPTLQTTDPQAAAGQPSCLADGSCVIDLAQCEQCDQSCGKLLAGAGAYIVKPFFDTNPALSVFRQGTGPGTRYDVRQQTMSYAPQAWLGWMNDDGLGFRARYWYLRSGTDQTYNFGAPNGSTPLTVFTAGPAGASIISDNAQAAAVTTKLELQVIDFEVVQQLSIANWNILVAGGLSHADISQNYNAYVIGASGNGARPLTSDHRFLGTGPEFAAELRRPILNTCINLYASTRTRFLYGTTHHTTFGGDELTGTQMDNNQSIVGIEELELGAEYSYYVGNARFFGQAAVVGQEWFGAGNASRSNVVSAPTTAPVFSGTDTSNFGLFGISLRLGVNY